MVLLIRNELLIVKSCKNIIKCTYFTIYNRKAKQYIHKCHPEDLYAPFAFEAQFEAKECSLDGTNFIGYGVHIQTASISYFMHSKRGEVSNRCFSP